MMSHATNARRGLSLATTLMLIGVLVVLGLTIAAVSLQTLNVSVRLGSLDKARQVAESAISVAIEKLLANPQYGQSRSPADRIQISLRAGDATGQVTFDGNGYSSNNLAQDVSVAGYGGTVVPPHSAHLIGLGTSGGIKREIETVVMVPPFPYAIACSGPFESTGGLYLAGVERPQDVAASQAQIDPAKLLPAHLLSNGIGPDAVKLGPNTTIAGDLRSAGGIHFDPGSTQILGEVVAHGPPRSIPRLDVGGLDPLLTGKTDVATLTRALVDSPAYQGFVRRQGDLSISGGLILDNGVLFVQGDLRISGGIRGVGAVIATGQLCLSGASKLSSDDHLALISGGAMSLLGQAAEASYFQGLVYAGGAFTAERITLVGSLIVQAEQALTSLIQVHLIRSPGLAQLQLSTAPTVNVDFVPASALGSLRVGLASSGFSIQDPDDESSESGLSKSEAADQVVSILSRRGLDGQVSRDQIMAQLERVAPPRPSPLPDFSLDPNSFLPVEERTRIVLWKER